MPLVSKQRIYERIVSDTCALDEVKRIISTHPQIIAHDVCHALPLDRLCMKRTSNPDIIIHLIEEGSKHRQLSSCRGGLIRDKGICMPPLKMLIFNDRIDVLRRLEQIKDPAMIQPQDIIKYEFLHFAVSHCRLEWVRYFLQLYPQAITMKDCNNMLPIHVCANEWHRHPDLFWGVFRLLLEEGVRQGVGGMNKGFGGLFVPTPKTNQSIIYDIFKCAGVTWEKISTIVKDKHVRCVLIRQLALGNIPKDHFYDIIKSFNDCLFVKDKKGRLPIHIAAQRGLKWEDGMKDIVEANFVGLAHGDDETGLYPFALAASSNGLEEKDLECIFELLRCFPDCCRIQFAEE